MKPGRHSHTKLPIVLVHVALGSQLSCPRAHSSMSVVVYKISILGPILLLHTQPQLYVDELLVLYIAKTADDPS